MFDFLDMGKYTAHIWSAYGITFVVLGLNILLPFLLNRNLLTKLRKRLTRTGKL